MKHVAVIRRDSYVQFLRSPLGAPGTMIPLLARTHAKKKREKEKETVTFLVCRQPLKQARLIKQLFGFRMM